MSTPVPPTLNPRTVALLRRYQAGDRAALEDLFASFYPRVERIVRVRSSAALRRRVPVEDLVQQTFLRALSRLEEFEIRADGRLIDWLARIAERSIADAVRHSGAECRDGGREVSADARNAEGRRFVELEAPTTGVPERVARAELEEMVDECLARLAAHHREVILLHDFAQADWEYIARETGRPSVNAAQQLYRRAKARLGAELLRRM